MPLIIEEIQNSKLAEEQDFIMWFGQSRLESGHTTWPHLWKKEFKKQYHAQCNRALNFATRENQACI